MGQFTDAGAIDDELAPLRRQGHHHHGILGLTQNDLALGVQMLDHARDKYPWFEMQTLYLSTSPA